ncbi:MAG TPA: FGGY-family carbohydrate kinase, partial [Aggregatilineales bacterium]|nr:FGGY-family carbohydrate kinase [Aggregatilineales bacterium]
RVPGEHRLNFLPLLAGERAPGWNTHATGAITGLRLSTTPLDILHAALEGIALRLRLIGERLFNEDVEIFAGGGALIASPAWQQIICDALNHPLHILDEEEVTARGVAILVLSALDNIPLDSYPPHIATTLTPHAEYAARYHALTENLTHIYEILIEI